MMLTATELEQYWKEWSAREEQNYKTITTNGTSQKKYLKKGYTHFDLRFWFPERKNEIKQIITDGLKRFNHAHRRKENWAFAPFLKIIIKTPRYKFQEKEEKYDLETKPRPISFSSHADSLIFGFYAFFLNRKYEEYIAEKGFDECVLAYRSNLDGKCNIQFSKEVFDEIKSRGKCTALALDIRGYFDHIDHGTLKQKWKTVLKGDLPDDQYRIFKALTGYSYVSKNSLLKKYKINLKKLPKKPNTLLELIPGEKDFEKFDQLRSDKLVVVNKATNEKTKKPIGIPQGSAMSALLSNMYLIDFDEEMYEKSKLEGFVYRRYCDDILIICDHERAEELQKFVIKKIDRECFLEIQPKKTDIIEFRPNAKGKIRGFNKKKLIETQTVTDASNEGKFYKSLQYLGFEYNGQDSFIRSSSLSRYFRKMKSRILKTIAMAYSDKSKGNRVWKEQLFHRYTHLGQRNFLSYAYNSAEETYTNIKGQTKSGMNSPAIRRQLRKHFDHLLRNLGKRNLSRYVSKQAKAKAKGKTVVFKEI